DRIAMKATGKLVVNAATRHLFERGLGHREHVLFLGFLIAFENQLNRGSVREFRRLAEAAVANVKKFGDRLNLRVNDAEIELGSCAVESLRLGDRVRQRIGGA